MQLQDLPPFPAVKRTRTHELQPGMLVRPRGPDNKVLDANRWLVEKVEGAFTRARIAHLHKRPCTKYWATDTLVPCKRKGGGVLFAKAGGRATSRPKPAAAPRPTKADDLKAPPIGDFAATRAPGAIPVPTKAAPKPRAEPDALALELAGCHGLDALLAVAAGHGYPDCDTLRSRVSHLNPGLQRMNVGNRLRSFFKTRA